MMVMLSAAFVARNHRWPADIGMQSGRSDMRQPHSDGATPATADESAHNRGFFSCGLTIGRQEFENE
jgi:hypothetical protein